jgi:hypothetical protein
MPLRSAGVGYFESFFLGQASGMVEPVAGVLGAYSVQAMEPILPYAMAFAAGPWPPSCVPLRIFAQPQRVDAWGSGRRAHQRRL